MAAKPRIPSYCLHKPSGRAVVKVKGKIIYLGKPADPLKQILS